MRYEIQFPLVQTQSFILNIHVLNHKHIWLYPVIGPKIYKLVHSANKTAKSVLDRGNKSQTCAREHGMSLIEVVLMFWIMTERHIASQICRCHGSRFYVTTSVFYFLRLTVHRGLHTHTFGCYDFARLSITRHRPMISQLFRTWMRRIPKEHEQQNSNKNKNLDRKTPNTAYNHVTVALNKRLEKHIKACETSTRMLLFSVIMFLLLFVSHCLLQHIFLTTRGRSIPGPMSMHGASTLLFFQLLTLRRYGFKTLRLYGSMTAKTEMSKTLCLLIDGQYLMGPWWVIG